MDIGAIEFDSDNPSPVDPIAPTPDPSVNDKTITNPSNLVLKASGLSSGYTVTKSHWKVYQGDTEVYQATENGATTSHKVSRELGDGAYKWTVGYEWSGPSGSVGTTPTSAPASITVKKSGSVTDPAAAGGCNAGLGMLLVLPLGLFFTRKKK